MKKLRVTVEGKAYEVLVEILDEGAPSAALSPAATAMAAPSVAPVATAPVAASKAAATAGDVVCPLAGKLVSIDVKIGQMVDEGAQLATVEAMKMNTYIYAPRAGKVTEILATVGEGAEEGMILLRLA